MGKTNETKSELACILEADESTRLRMEDSLPKYHEYDIAGQGDNSLQHYDLAHKFVPISHEDSRSKSSSGPRMGETCKDSGVGLDKSQK